MPPCRKKAAHPPQMGSILLVQPSRIPSSPSPIHRHRSQRRASLRIRHRSRRRASLRMPHLPRASRNLAPSRRRRRTRLPAVPTTQPQNLRPRLRRLLRPRLLRPRNLSLPPRVPHPRHRPPTHQPPGLVPAAILPAEAPLVKRAATLSTLTARSLAGCPETVSIPARRLPLFWVLRRLASLGIPTTFPWRPAPTRSHLQAQRRSSRAAWTLLFRAGLCAPCSPFPAPRVSSHPPSLARTHPMVRHAMISPALASRCHWGVVEMAHARRASRAHELVTSLCTCSVE